MKLDTDLDLKLSAEEVVRALVACQVRIEELAHEVQGLHLRSTTYRQMLQIMGHADAEIQKMMAKARENTVSRGPKKPSATRFKGRSIADAAATVLSESPSGKMHAREILGALEIGGLKIGGKAPKATLFSTLVRSDRIERVSGEPNTWRLKRNGQLVLGG